MRNRIIICIVILLALTALGLTVYFRYFKDDREAVIEVPREDRILISVKTGKGLDKISYRFSERSTKKRMIAVKGPSAFAVGENEKIYISDSVKKRIKVFMKQRFLYDIKVPFSSDICNICVAGDLIYFIDGTIGGKVYGVDSDGKVIKEISLPGVMEGYITESLFMTEDGRMALVCYSQEGSRAEEDEGDVYEAHTYLLDELEKGNVVRIKGYAKNFSDGAVLNGSDLTYLEKTVTLRSELNPDLTTGTVIGIDKEGNVYVDVYEAAKTQTVAGENTVQRFKDGVCTGILKTDISKNVFTPHFMRTVSDDGELYLMNCYKDRVEVSKKTFISPEKFRSGMKKIEKRAKKRDGRLR